MNCPKDPEKEIKFVTINKIVWLFVILSFPFPCPLSWEKNIHHLVRLPGMRKKGKTKLGQRPPWKDRRHVLPKLDCYISLECLVGLEESYQFPSYNSDS